MKNTIIICGCQYKAKELQDKIKQTKNKRQKNLSSERRVKRDRLEMLLTLNSLEHQVKQYGDTAFKFSFVDNGVEKSFYKRSIREELPEEKGGDWYKFITEPDIEVFHKLCDKYKSEEKIGIREKLLLPQGRCTQDNDANR